MIQRLLLGRPLPTTAARDDRLGKLQAIGAFGLDALSSVAYGPDEILYVLVLAGAAGTRFGWPIAIARPSLPIRMAAAPAPSLGRTSARASASSRRRRSRSDYLTTIAVSVTAGVAAILAFLPVLGGHRVALDVAAIVAIMLINLRGVREAGATFTVPTYAFIGSVAAVLLWGGVHVLFFGPLPRAAAPPQASLPVSNFLILRAFAGGCTAMTGVEAIANGVPAFKGSE